MDRIATTLWAAIVLLAAILGIEARCARADDEPVTVIVRFYPTAGREDELLTRLTRLRDYVNANVPGVTYRLYRARSEPTMFLLYETFPSQTAVEEMAKTVFPAFQKQAGPIPQGIVTRPVEPERFTELRP